MERVESAGPPSPKSLGDGLEESLVSVSVSGSQDVDRGADTQLDLADGGAMEDTQVVEDDEEEADEVVLVSLAGVQSAGTAGLQPAMSV